MSFGYLDIESDINFPVRLPKPVLAPGIKSFYLPYLLLCFIFVVQIFSVKMNSTSRTFKMCKYEKQYYY